MVSNIIAVKEADIYKIYNPEEDVQNVLVMGKKELSENKIQANDVFNDLDP